MLTWSQDRMGLRPSLKTREKSLAPGALLKLTRSPAAALQRDFACTRHSWSADKWACKQQCLVHGATYKHQVQQTVPSTQMQRGAGRGPNECMSCIILGLTKLFRLNQVENNQNGSRLHSRAHICGIRQITFTNILLRCGLINAIHGNNQLYPWFTPSYQHFLLILQACSVQAVCCERWNHQGSQISTVVANYLIRMLYRIKLGYLCQI